MQHLDITSQKSRRPLARHHPLESHPWSQIQTKSRSANSNRRDVIFPPTFTRGGLHPHHFHPTKNTVETTPAVTIYYYFPQGRIRVSCREDYAVPTVVDIAQYGLLISGGWRSDECSPCARECGSSATHSVRLLLQVLGGSQADLSFCSSCHRGGFRTATVVFVARVFVVSGCNGERRE